MSGTQRILVSDHNQPIIEAVSWLLGERGYEIHIAASSQDAIEIAVSCKPALLIIDPIMPGITGIDAARRISEQAKSKVLFLSAAFGEQWLDEEIQSLRLSGCDCDAFSRPFEQEALLRQVEKLVGPPTTRSATDHIEQSLDQKIAALDAEIATFRSLANRTSTVEARKEVTPRFATLVDERVRLGLSQKLGRDYAKLNFRDSVDCFAGQLEQLSQTKVLADADYQLGLSDGDRMAWLLEPLIKASLMHLDQDSAPSVMRLEWMIVLGVRTHCICFRGPFRFKHDSIAVLEKLYHGWLLEGLTAPSKIRGYDEANRGTPMTIFNLAFDREIQPLQKSLRLSWWQRWRNREKFYRSFAEGILLAVMYDTGARECRASDQSVRAEMMSR